MSPRFKVAEIVFFTILLVISVEGLSYFLVVHVFDQGLGNIAERHLYSPIRGHKLNPDYNRNYDTNNTLLHSEQGFRRDGLISKHKQDNTIRIFMMGGSTLYGIGKSRSSAYPAHPTLQNSETVSHYLEKGLNERFAARDHNWRIEVINAGVVAYQTFHHVLYILETIYEYEPDIVIFLDGHNDFYNVGEHNSIIKYGYSSWRMVQALNERKPFFSLSVAFRPLGEFSYFFKLVEKIFYTTYVKVEGVKHKTWRFDEQFSNDDVLTNLSRYANNSFLRNYRLVQTLASYHDFEIHVFLQPEVVFESKAILSAQDSNIARITLERYPEKLIATMRMYRKKFRKIFAEHGVPFTDVGEIGSAAEKKNRLYVDYVHLTPRGSWVVAQRMLPVVEEMVLERVAKRQAVLNIGLKTLN